MSMYVDIKIVKINTAAHTTCFRTTILISLYSEKFQHLSTVIVITNQVYTSILTKIERDTTN